MSRLCPWWDLPFGEQTGTEILEREDGGQDWVRGRKDRSGGGWWKGDPRSDLSALSRLFQGPPTIIALPPEELPPLQPPLPMTVTDPWSWAGTKH